MPGSEAIEFILKRTSHTDVAAAKALADALGCLPLALEQAAAYIEASGSTLTHYLDLFNTSQKEILQRGKPATDYNGTVATT